MMEMLGERGLGARKIGQGVYVGALNSVSFEI